MNRSFIRIGYEEGIGASLKTTDIQLDIAQKVITLPARNHKRSKQSI